VSRNLSRLLTAALGLILVACADSDPAGPATDRAPVVFASQAGGNDKTSLDLIEADYADGLLDRDNANRYREYAVSAPDRLPSKYRSAVVGKDATWSMLQLALEWDRLARSTQQEILDLRGDGFGQLKDSVLTAHFALHYTTQGNHAVPSQDADGNGVSDFMDVPASSWETIWSREIDQLGYPAPKGTPQQRFHVYYRNIPYYGYTVPENLGPCPGVSGGSFPCGTASGWIVVENDFYGFPPNDEDRTGAETIRSGALKVTQAHEFMHASQFNINVYQSGWLFESHATWAEDAVYDGINDWRWYVPRFLRTPDLPIFNRFVYGAAFFQHWLSESYDEDLPRRIWFAGRTRSTADAVRDIAFGGSWEGMKLFAPAEYLLDISDYTADPPSVVPVPRNLIRATHTQYPVAVQVAPSKANVDNRAPWGLGANFIEFLPAGSGALTVTFDGADGYAWRAFVVVTPARGGPVQRIELTLEAAGAGTATVGQFGTRWSKVTLVPTIADRPGAEVPFAYAASVQ
jgi:hypothetical protein